MDNTVEATAKPLIPDEIRLNRTAAAVVLPLAIYGGQDLTRKAISKTRNFVANQKARRAAKKEQSASTPEA
jgi:hypothetical protein